MKAMRNLFILAILTATLVSCTRSTDNTTLTTAATVGNWKVSLFQEEKDETSDYAGWTFTFESNGTATAIKGSATVTGSWALKESKFKLDFGADNILRHISDDWIIIEKTDTSIKLKDDNTLKIELLQFVKI